MSLKQRFRLERSSNFSSHLYKSEFFIERTAFPLLSRTSSGEKTKVIFLGISHKRFNKRRTYSPISVCTVNGNIENVTLVNNNTHSYISDNGIIFRCGKRRGFVVQFFFKVLNDHGCEKHLCSSCAPLKLIFGHSVNFHTLLIFPLQNIINNFITAMSVHLNVAAVRIAYTEHGDFFRLYKKKLHQHFCVTLRHTVKFFVFSNTFGSATAVEALPKSQFRFP